LLAVSVTATLKAVGVPVVFHVCVIASDDVAADPVSVSGVKASARGPE
jgi:hypothetical protein